MPGCDCNIHRTVEPHTKQKRENASAANDLKGRKVDMMKGLGKVGGGAGVVVAFKFKETESCTANADTRVAELKGTAGDQLDRERRGDAGRCDTVTFASTNGLSGFCRTVWCSAPNCEPRMHLAQQD